MYICIALIFIPEYLSSQYVFTTDKKVQCTPVKNQEKTGTCWSFATTSFLESELMRSGKSDLDLSEMYVVRKIYEDKAFNYVLRQGKTNFSQGGLSHDLIRSIAREGIIPEKFYRGLVIGDELHNHSELEKGMKGYLDAIINNGHPGNKWKDAVKGILDAYLGPIPEVFEVDGQTYNAKSFANALEIKDQDYISITSFNHHPFYETFILEIPDNYSNGSYYNIPLDEMEELIDFALIAGYSIVWDGDVSEKGFNSKEGLAILPQEMNNQVFNKPVQEIEVDQNNRQAAFESYETTDDHLMHIVGISLDQNGSKYYITKNSWGINNQQNGYIYMSASYLRMKTISIMVNKSALPLKTSRRLFASK
jgi:bleomycin hydrolase